MGEITASKIHTRDGMGERVALIDGNDVSHTISRVNHSASGATRSIQRQCGLDGNVEVGGGGGGGQVRGTGG